MKLALWFSLLACCVSAFAAPQGVHIGPDGSVGASFGGYHASAGLGGLLGGGPKGGLHAQAGTPLGHFASAGLSGSVGQGGAQGIKYAGAVKPGYVAQPVQVAAPAPAPAQPVYVEAQPETVYVQSTEQPAVYVQPVVQPVQPVYKPQSSAFNDIFNIPISALQAVNRYLNNKPHAVAVFPAAPVYIQGRSNTEPKETKAESQAKSSSSSGSSSTSAVASSASASSASSSSSSAASSSSTSSGNAHPEVLVPVNQVPGVVVSKGYRTRYDDIFNIPISVLRSVNNLLNG